MDLQNKLFMWLIFFLSLSEAAFTSLIKENESPMYSVGSALRYLSKAVFTKALLNGELFFNHAAQLLDCRIWDCLQNLT